MQNKVDKCLLFFVLKLEIKDFLTDTDFLRTLTRTRTQPSTSDELPMIVINAFPFGSEAFGLFRHSQELQVTRVTIEIVVGAPEFLRSGLVQR